MTRGGPNKATWFYVLNVFFNAFRSLRMGYASAQAWILFLIIMSLTLVIFKSAGRLVYYEAAQRRQK
jgi:multiple sugar transport system permease protein